MARGRRGTVDEWRGWFSGGGKVWRDMVRVRIHRDIWHGMQDVLREGGDLPNSYFWQYLADTYLDSQVIAIRRLSEDERRSQNLRRMLGELADRPQQINLREWMQYDGGSRHHWVREFGEPVDGHLDRECAQALILKLKDACDVVARYANDYTAHASRTPSITELRWDDLDAAIDGVWSVYLACEYMVTGVKTDYEKEAVLGASWDSVFDVPWRGPSA